MALTASEALVWIELDEVARIFDTVLIGDGRSFEMPSQMLALLPPPPPGGWPPEFELADIAERLEARAAGQPGAWVAEDDDDLTRSRRRYERASPPPTFVRLDGAYPPRKRAERLSWAVWAVIGDQKVGVNSFGGSPYQPLIEAESTAERLRLVRLRLHELKQQLRRRSAD